MEEDLESVREGEKDKDDHGEDCGVRLAGGGVGKGREKGVVE